MVIDTSVLIDMFLTSRPRHQRARQLACFIQEHNIAVTLPMHAILEIKCAIDSERQSATCGEISAEFFSEKCPLRIIQIPIDSKFISEYLDITVPYIKSGDLLFVLVAKKHQYPLITEDTKQYQVAKSAGVETYHIQEYLDTHS